MKNASATGDSTGKTLRIEGLTVTFGGLHAIADLSVAIDSGEFVGIVGPNGAGKSTLIQAITGFVRPSAGRITLAGDRLDGKPPEQIAAAGVARSFQTSRVFPALAVRDSVLVGTQRRLIDGDRVKPAFGPFAEPLAILAGLPAYLARRKDCEERADRVIKLFGDRLWSRRDDPAHSLSYANRRRLDIARALVSEPDILLLDEPTAGMNPTETNELAELLLDVHRRFPAMSIVMIEHKLDVIRRLTNRTIVMNQGRLLVDDRPDAALDHPDVAAAYLGSARGTAIVPPQPGTMNLAPAGSAPRTGQPVVELSGVDVFYGSVQALFGISIKVEEGEVVAVLGGNASGKSTTVKTVLRLVRATRGEVRIFGRTLSRESTADVIAAGVASIPEGRRMFAELSVRDNLLMGAYARRSAHDLRLDDELGLVLAEFPWLSSRLDQLAGTLSGGEQQMVAMARAWLRRPRLLCIDEPSMGLSPKMVDRIYDILFRWKAQGLTILMVEQSANRALELADRAYVLRNGVIALEGQAAALRADSAVQRAYLGDQGVSDHAA